jgi:hypothetical protein
MSIAYQFKIKKIIIIMLYGPTEWDNTLYMCTYVIVVCEDCYDKKIIRMRKFLSGLDRSGRF